MSNQCLIQGPDSLLFIWFKLWISAVKGLQVLATFPESFTAVSKSMYESILSGFISIITSDSNKTFSWTSTLKALVEIGSFVDKCKLWEFVEKIVSLIPSDDPVMPLSLKLQAAFEIGATRKDFMLRVVHGLDETIFTKFSAANVCIFNLTSSESACMMQQNITYAALHCSHLF